MPPALDDLVGLDPLERRILQRANQLAKKPAQLAAFLNGLILDGSHEGARPRLKTALEPYLKLPKPEPDRQVRARMARLIESQLAANDRVTREDLEAGGFSDLEITRHFRSALRIARAPRIVA